MPCSDSSSSMVIKLDHDEKFITFDYAKITCGREITGSTGLNGYCKGRTLPEILEIPFSEISSALDIKEEENKFILYSEWDVLRAGIALYMGIDDPHIDSDRCSIISIEYTDEGIEIAEIVLPPKELPKILPCNLADQ
ncbi:MAG: hypothetical protein AB7S78_00495 [Candidatus Omnitrophota bacterium]